MTLELSQHGMKYCVCPYVVGGKSAISTLVSFQSEFGCSWAPSLFGFHMRLPLFAFSGCMKKH